MKLLQTTVHFKVLAWMGIKAKREGTSVSDLTRKAVYALYQNSPDPEPRVTLEKRQPKRKRVKTRQAQKASRKQLALPGTEKPKRTRKPKAEGGMT